LNFIIFSLVFKYLTEHAHFLGCFLLLLLVLFHHHLDIALCLGQRLLEFVDLIIFVLLVLFHPLKQDFYLFVLYVDLPTKLLHLGRKTLDF